MGTATQNASRLNRLLTATELSEHIGEAKATVYTLAREKGMPCIRFGRAMRFDPEAVREWLARGGTGGKGEGG